MVHIQHRSPLGAMGGFQRTERGIACALGVYAELTFGVDVVRPDIVRFWLARDGVAPERPTFATAYRRPISPAFEVRVTPSELVVETERLRVMLAREAFHVDVTRTDGSAVLEGARDPQGRSQAYLSLNDGLVLSRRAAPSDRIFGLGEKTGRFDRRGRRFVMWNIDVLAPDVLGLSRLAGEAPTLDPESTEFDPSYCSIPFFQHARRVGETLLAAGFFLDNAELSRFDFSAPDVLRCELTAGPYVEYVFAGPTLAEILEAYTFVTGRMQRPPLWSLGHHQCRWHAYSDEQVLAIGREYRRRDLPCDALWLDIEHMDDYRVFSFHPERFPNPERFTERAAAEGLRVVAIVDPGVKLEPGDPLFEEGRAGNLFAKTRDGGLYEGRVWPGRTVFPDFAKADARAWWGGLVARSARRGISGIWNDMNEPATGAIEPFAMRFDRDGENHPHERFHNQYALAMAMATVDGLLAARPRERPFVLSRAGFAGIQRFAAQWLGDHSASFAHLALGVPMALGFGMSGQPFVGGDVPGYAGHATPELAARWFEYAALTPFSRCHHQIEHDDHYPWSFGDEVECIAREALRLRYRLLPYLYSAFVDASLTGEPVQRPLVFDFQNDERSAGVDDQYLLGRALLVAPVLAEGQRERPVYLPPGEWLNFHDGRTYTGGRTLTVPAPLDRIPLFVRGGGVIPMLPHAPATTLGLAPELLELHVYVPSGDSAGAGGTLHEDDGWSLAYRQGAWLRTDFEVVRNPRLLVRARTSGRGFGEHRRERYRLVLHGYDGYEVELGGERFTLEDVASGAARQAPARALEFACGAQGFELVGDD